MDFCEKRYSLIEAERYKDLAKVAVENGGDVKYFTDLQRKWTERANEMECLCGKCNS